MAHLQERESLSGAISGPVAIWARALRVALIIFPILSLSLVIIAAVKLLPDLEEFWGLSGRFIILQRSLIPLCYLAVGLWAADRLKPIKILNPQVLKWVLIGLAIALPAAAIYHDHDRIVPWILHITIPDGAFFVVTFVRVMLSVLSLACFCLFVASKIDARTSPPAEMSRAAAALRRALMIVPILGMVVFTLELLWGAKDVSLAVTPNYLALVLQDILMPLAYLAIGLLAANRIKPVQSLDVRFLKWGLLALAIVQPVLILYNDYMFYARFPDDQTWFSLLLDDGAISLIHLTSAVFLAFAFIAICVFIAHKINEAEREPDRGAP